MAPDEPRESRFLREQCVKANVRLQVVELDADLGQIKHRLNARDETSAEISDACLEDFEKLNAAYEPPSGLARESMKISTTIRSPIH
jgi:hypothetical protein